MVEKSYYDILGIPKNSSEMEIKKAFRKLVRKYHPDVSEHPNADEKIVEINNAYETLGEEEKRAEYDAIQFSDFTSQSPEADAFSDFGRKFDEFTSTYSSTNQSSNAQSNANATSQKSSQKNEGKPRFAWEDFKEQFGESSPFGSGSFRFDDILSTFNRGTRKDGRSQSHTHASKRQSESQTGAGFSGFEQFGTGSYTSKGQDQHAEINVDLASVYTGDTYNIKINAPYRKTNGSISHEQRTLKVQVPIGIVEGNQIRLSNQGSVSMDGGDNGDLFLKVKIHKADNIRLDGVDVYQTINVAPWEVALGEEINIETPAGKFDVSIPKNIQSGSSLRLTGKGIPASPSGDLYLVINIINPSTTSMSLEQQHAFESLKMAYKDVAFLR